MLIVLFIITFAVVCSMVLALLAPLVH